MKHLIYFIMGLVIVSCNEPQENKSKELTKEELGDMYFSLLQSQALDLSKKYLIAKTPHPKLSVDSENIFIDNGEYPFADVDNPDYFNYTIPKKDILVGDLNNDRVSDVAVHVVQSWGGTAATSSYLIFLNNEGKLILNHHEKDFPVFFTNIDKGILYGIEEKRDADYNRTNRNVKYQLIEKKLVEVE